jgi:sulfhydrogenase subunit beta (sulfur reductase)
MHFIDSTNFERLLKELSRERELYVPVQSEETGKNHLWCVEEFPLPEGMNMGGYRTVEPLKGIAQRLRCPVAEYPSPERDQMPELQGECVIAGARACDIYAFELVDRVQTEGEYIDPFYKVRREKMLIVGADCTDCGESCFCNLLGNNPWPERGFDLSVSRVSGGFLIEAGSDRGEKILQEQQKLLAEPREAQIKSRESNRQEMLEKLSMSNRDFPEAEEVPEIIRGALTDDIWDEIAKDCVECGACTNICPTCYCFLLYDQKLDGEHFQRVLSWDSCQLTGYARMAGMLNARPRLTDRVMHRYYHKYDYLLESHGDIFCTGCGRCIDACSAGIDMREAFREVKDKFIKQG